MFIALAPVGVDAQEENIQNQLKDHASPYLAMHGEDPVHWQEWGEAAFARARKENKLLYLSSGYFSCHWCHVMQRESYRNKVIAEVLNREFIPIKVDRELNPALDARLIEFVELTRGYAGWPLNVFITPDGYPLVGVVYLPPDKFLATLQSLAKEWRSRHAELKMLAIKASEELSTSSETSEKLDKETVMRFMELFVEQSLEAADEIMGGFGEQNKFPSVPQLQLLLHLLKIEPSERVHNFLQLTLNNMASQGLRDHLGGGFFRYTVDPNWRTPHFEKMLYDNAQTAMLYLYAAEVMQNDNYKKIAKETLDFMPSALATKEGALAASLSAVDAAGVEGGAYLWRKEELQKLLNKDEMALAERYWGLHGAPEFEAGHHLRLNDDLKNIALALRWPFAKAEQMLEHIKVKLIKARAKRTAPLDAKKLAAWNGLALSAMVYGARVFTASKYDQAAKRIRDYLYNALWDGKRLQRAQENNNSLGEAGLEDYAFVSTAVLDWAEFSNNTADVHWAKKLVDEAWRLFYGEQGWRLEARSLLRYRAGKPVVMDSAMASPAALLVHTSLRLLQQQDDKVLRKKVEQALMRGHAEIREAVFWYPTQLRALALYFSNE